MAKNDIIQMKLINLSPCTYIIPIRLESEDRIRNIITCLVYLLDNFKASYIIKEHDKTSVFNEVVLPQLEEYFGDDLKQIDIKHQFVQSDDPVFPRQRLINEMIDEVKTPVVVNYDCDVLIDRKGMKDGLSGITHWGGDISYPYGHGNFQRRVRATDELVTKFIENHFDFEVFYDHSDMWTSDYGWVQFIKKDQWVNLGMENEEFVAYAPEDKERFWRFKKFNKRIYRGQSIIYHLEHSRSPNSWFTNPHMKANQELWEKLEAMDPFQLLKYYTYRPYYDKYSCIQQLRESRTTWQPNV